MKATNEMQRLLEQLLSVTKDLRDQVFGDHNNIEEWVKLIDSREEVIKEISSLQNQGTIITSENKKKYILEVYNLDQEVFPLLEQKYDELDRQSKNVQKSLVVGAKYGGYGNINPYGAYFDKRN